MNAFRKDIDGFRNEVREDMNEFRSEIRKDMDEFRRENKEFHGRLCAIEERNKK